MSAVCRECPRQPDALLHASRELTAIAIAPLRESYELELFVDDAASFVRWLAAELETKADVVPHRSPWEQAELLEYHRDPEAAYSAQRRRIAFRDIDDIRAIAD